MQRLFIGVGIALAASTPSLAQTSTQCRWIGSIWSCDTQASGNQVKGPLDQGAIMRSGAALVPNYAEENARQKQLELRERELRLRERELDAREQKIGPTPKPSIEDTPRLYTIEEARTALGVPPEYGLTPDQQRALNPAIRQCGSDLASMRGIRKGDDWYDWAPADEDKRGYLKAICAAYHVGIADGISIGDKAARSGAGPTPP